MVVLAAIYFVCAHTVAFRPAVGNKNKFTTKLCSFASEKIESCIYSYGTNSFVIYQILSIRFEFLLLCSLWNKNRIIRFDHDSFWFWVLDNSMNNAKPNSGHFWSSSFRYFPHLSILLCFFLLFLSTFSCDLLLLARIFILVACLGAIEMAFSDIFIIATVIF